MKPELLKVYMTLRGWDTHTLAEILQIPQEEIERWIKNDIEIPRCYGLLIVMLGEELVAPSSVALAHETIDLHTAGEAIVNQ